MDRIYIQAVGLLLTNYYKTLKYIETFQQFKDHKITSDQYLNIKDKSSFISLINDFKVSRNVRKEMVNELLDETIKWVNLDKADDVDLFAGCLKEKEITQNGKLMTSLASKILFINNPWKIIPLDSLAKFALNIRNNGYTTYVNKIKELQINNSQEFKAIIDKYSQELVFIEKASGVRLENIELIRLNRFTDMVLWSLGKEKKRVRGL